MRAPGPLHTRLASAAVARLVTVVVCCLALLSASAMADDKDVGIRLAKIKAEVGSTEHSLEQLKIEFAKLKKEEKTLEGAILRLGTEEQALVARSEQLVREKESLVGKVKAAEEAVSRQHGLIRERLRVLYMNKAVSSPRIFLSSSAQFDSERLALYARSVRAHDEARFHEVKQAVEALIASRQSLDRSLNEAKGVQQGLQAKRVEAEGQRVKLKLVMQQIKEKQETAQRSLALLMSEAAKLEKVMQALTGGEKPPSLEEEVDQLIQPKPQVDTEDKPTPAQEVVPERVGGRRLQDVMHPEGLFGKSVRVVYPVKGDVLQRFGKAKVTDFSDMIFSKGLEFKTAEGSQVRAVLGGKVAFSGVMPGYDTVVIIDHGSRSYSLYGRLGKSLVQKGDIIGQKDPVGLTSAPDTKGRNFYFETRKNGSPVDPTSVLSRAS
jgi:septal ring factor EnvC (AmiA/AmiB activator)